jgi:stage II sporulation protein D
MQPNDIPRFKKSSRLAGLLLILILPSLRATEIKIGLFFGREISSVVFSVVEGEYILFGDNRQITAVRPGSMFHIDNTAGFLVVQDTSLSYGSFSRIEFRGIGSTNIFRIKPVFPSLPAKESDDHLTLVSEGGIINLINQLDLEGYIAGTVEAEGGWKAHSEYYKAQAVLIRTFAIKNFNRHGSEGFNLCDTEHCQAYKGKSRMNREIHLATKETAGEVLTDLHDQMVITPYHSNCGGQTADALLVWQQPLPHLHPVNDPFCGNARNARWEVVKSRKEWIEFVERMGYDKKENQQASFSYNPQSRVKFFVSGNIKIPATTIRKELGLKSAWFSMTAGPDSVVIQGRGFGHGVGLCQEGAMEMAERGFVYVDILHFYFNHVLIMRIKG